MAKHLYLHFPTIAFYNDFEHTKLCIHPLFTSETNFSVIFSDFLTVYGATITVYGAKTIDS